LITEKINYAVFLVLLWLPWQLVLLCWVGYGLVAQSCFGKRSQIETEGGDQHQSYSRLLQGQKEAAKKKPVIIECLRSMPTLWHDDTNTFDRMDMDRKQRQAWERASMATQMSLVNRVREQEKYTKQMSNKVDKILLELVNQRLLGESGRNAVETLLGRARVEKAEAGIMMSRQSSQESFSRAPRLRSRSRSKNRSKSRSNSRSPRFTDKQEEPTSKTKRQLHSTSIDDVNVSTIGSPTALKESKTEEVPSTKDVGEMTIESKAIEDPMPPVVTKPEEEKRGPEVVQGPIPPVVTKLEDE